MRRKKSARIYWCDFCHVPLLGEICGSCGRKGRNMAAATLVPVFSQEINYLRKNIPQTLHPWLRELELWTAPGSYTYYLRGKALFKLSVATDDVKILREEDLPPISKRRNRKDIILILKKANQPYIEQLQYEAENFIREITEKFNGRPILVSFSCGKDSTVVSHLTMNALGRSDILHIFADTSIEIPDSYQYLQTFQKEHPLTPIIAEQSHLDFFKTSESIGPPSRILRWCCSTHKTNPLSKLIRKASGNQGVLTFDGIRKAESSQRSQYPKISSEHKIAREILARPILNWSDSAIWIYILYHEIMYNQAYNKGFRRVGCLYCPFTSNWSTKMIKHHYPNNYSKWENFLSNQAEKMMHPNPDSFVKNGWKARAGGRGLDYYKTTIEAAPCLLSDTAISYQLLSGEIKKVRHFLRPLGRQTHVKSNDCSETFMIHDKITHEISASVEIDYENQIIKVDFLLKKYARLFRQRLEKQLRKLQACIYCGSCEVKCTHKALNSSGNYLINADNCVGCLACVSHKCPAVKSLHFRRKED